jgi:hypothetical protein
MRLSVLKKTRVILAVSGASLIAAAAVVALSHGAAQANDATETPFVSYTAPTGPEMSSSAVANTAVHYVREWGDDSEVVVELAHGTLTQARTLMEGGSLAMAQVQESQLKSATPSSTFCFGGQNASCTAAEQQHAKETLYDEGQASTYLVVMSGNSLTPPERLPKGEKPVVSDKVILLIDAHTGIRVGMTIGAGMTVPNLKELQGASRFVAAPQSTTARVASVTTKPRYNRGSHPKPNFGSVTGTFMHQGEVVVLTSQHSVFTRTWVRRQHFHIALIFMGSYSIAGRLTSGRYCPAKKITIRPQRETIVHLTC